METVLYQYHFEWLEYLQNLIPLAVGSGFFTLTFLNMRAQKHRDDIRGFATAFSKILGFIGGIIGMLLFLISTLGMLTEHFEYRNALENDSVYSVEGYVQNFHPMPNEGHDVEHFEISGIYFEYTDYEIMNGYNTTASHGGVITQNGQYLKIKYIKNEYDNDRNIILYIAEVEPAE
ncbi:MAG: hypothetical protein IJX13_04570 [Clostridia bacterium]|nr:hypothetical protein [Clostridia bacterium]